MLDLCQLRCCYTVVPEQGMRPFPRFHDSTQPPQLGYWSALSKYKYKYKYKYKFKYKYKYKYKYKDKDKYNHKNNCPPYLNFVPGGEQVRRQIVWIQINPKFQTKKTTKNISTSNWVENIKFSNYLSVVHTYASPSIKMLSC